MIMMLPRAAAPMRPLPPFRLPVVSDYRGVCCDAGPDYDQLCCLIYGVAVTNPSSAGKLYLVVGYDGSAPAVRALDGAVRLLSGRDGSIEVVYVAHLTSLEMMSADAIAEMEISFDQTAQDLRAQAAEQLAGREERWRFERRQGMISEQLVAAATQIVDAHPGDIAAIVVGSSSQAAHRMVGSVAVSLARHAPVPLLIVP
jgi:nucleotide-binding universal stress UspA family protein